MLTSEQIQTTLKHGKFEITSEVPQEILLELDKKFVDAIKWRVNPFSVSVDDFDNAVIELQPVGLTPVNPAFLIHAVFRHKRTGRQQVFGLYYVLRLATVFDLIGLAYPEKVQKNHGDSDS